MIDIRDDLALEGSQPEQRRNFLRIGLPIGIGSATFLFVGIFFLPTLELRSFAAIALLMGAVFSLTECLEKDFGRNPPTPIWGGIITGFLLCSLALSLILLVRFVMGP